MPTAVASGTAANTAVYNQSVATGPADITQAGGLSPYGTMGQGGNVFEWEETDFDLVNDSSSSARGFRGNIWFANSSGLSSSNRSSSVPTFESIFVGFRVASIPEPSSLLGDYNGNGSVDAADYTVWKDSFGSSVNLAADGDGSGEIDAGDYTVWVNHFGESSALSATVPEPTSLCLLVGLAGSLLLKRQR